MSPVVVVGAGPTGLMLAGELRLAGVPVVVLERLPAPTGQSRAPGVYAGTLHTWDQRGLLDRFAGHLRFGAYGHFALLPGGLDLSVLDTPRAAALVPQATVEAVLADWAAELGAEIRRGHEVIDLRHRPDGVDIEVSGPAGRYWLPADYLVGCDGGHSAVRALAGFGFAGTESTVDVLLADLSGLDPAEIDLPRRPFPFLRTERGWVGLSLVTADSVRVFVCDFARPPVRNAGPPTFAEVAAAVADLAGIDITAGTPRWLSRFGNATRQVDTNRRGRVLLAGDAAHVHPPFGGQGIGVGIQDAVNLGWKLAASLEGWAPPDLLDTYQGERHPAAARVLGLTQAQDALMQGGPAVASLRDFVAELAAFPDANRHLAGEVTGVNLRYDLGDPAVGHRLPHRVLTRSNGTQVDSTALLRSARGLLLDPTGDLAPAVEPWRDRVDLVTARGAGDLPLLVRPDGHVAWAGHSGPEAALRRWFGEPSNAALTGVGAKEARR